MIKLKLVVILILVVVFDLSFSRQLDPYVDHNGASSKSVLNLISSLFDDDKKSFKNTNQWKLSAEDGLADMENLVDGIFSSVDHVDQFRN